VGTLTIGEFANESMFCCGEQCRPEQAATGAAPARSRNRRLEEMETCVAAGTAQTEHWRKRCDDPQRSHHGTHQQACVCLFPAYTTPKLKIIGECTLRKRLWCPEPGWNSSNKSASAFLESAKTLVIHCCPGFRATL